VKYYVNGQLLQDTSYIAANQVNKASYPDYLWVSNLRGLEYNNWEVGTIQLPDMCDCSAGCGGKVCGDDGCGGVCGICDEGDSCVDNLCTCIPDCDGKECGDDGCGGLCGICPYEAECFDDDSAGQCQPKGTCDPPCGPDSICSPAGACAGDYLTLCPDEDPNDQSTPACGFMMGTDGGSPADAMPDHLMTLGPYSIDRTEVTAMAFSSFLAQNGLAGPEQEPWYLCDGGPLDCSCDGEGCTPDYTPLNVCQEGACDQHPIWNVTWHGANAYCQWVGKRLCTEAEWEFAATGETGQGPDGQGRVYPWPGELWPVAPGTFANCQDGICKDGYPLTAPVGSFQDGTTPAGLFDLAGNVAEWVADWYANDWYCEGPDGGNDGYDLEACLDPAAGWSELLTGPCQGGGDCEPLTHRVVRGGSYLSSPNDLKTWSRASAQPDSGAANIGFRCCADLPLAPNI
jgi:formylglycine-generating enzyme required for sulfatase activity